VPAHPPPLPNLLAVDFHRRGDAFGVVDTLNGV
jgi:hypothetical protein